MFAALLSPAVRALPAWTAATAGRGAWLTGLTAFPPLLLCGWLWALLLRRTPAGGGPSEAFQGALGKPLGKALTIIYMVWALFLLCLEGRLYGERMLSAGYRGASLAAFLLVLLGLVLWMGRRKLSAFARAAEMFYLILSLTLGLVLVFAILDITPENVLPVWTGDLPGVVAATAVPVGVLCAGVYGAFLAGGVSPRPDDGRRGLRWLAAGCVVLALLQFGVLAQLGPELSARLDAPFFEVARGVGVAGAFQRVESVAIALWVLSDLALMGMLLFAGRAMAGAVFGPKGGKWAPVLLAALAFLGGLMGFRDGAAAKYLAATVAPAGNLLLAFPVPLLVLLIGAARERKK